MSRSYYPPHLLVDPYDQDALNGGIFSKIKKTVEKAVPKELKKISKYAKYIAPIAALIPGFGWAIALGVKATGAAYEEAKAEVSALRQKSADMGALWSEYLKLAGKVPGRAMGVALASDIWRAAIIAGKFPQGGVAWVTNAIESCAKGCGAGLRAVVKQAIAAGVTHPAQILEQYFLPAVDQTWGTKWGTPTDAVGSQVIIDVIDSLIGELDPSAPLHYGVRESAEPESPVKQPMPSPNAGPIKRFPPSAPPRLTPAPSPVSPAPQSLAPNVTPPQVEDAIARLTRQFMQTQQAQQLTAQQAISAAAASAQQRLAAQGVQVSPQQAAESAERAVTQAGTSNAPLWFGLAALVFAVAIPRGAGPARRPRGKR